MAIMYPSHPLLTNSAGEVTVFERLKQALSDEWSVFHSYRWNRNIGLRENDFILINKLYGIIVVEVKGGRVECLGHGEWRVTDRFAMCHKIQDPYKQVAQGQVKIFRELENHLRQYYHNAVKCFRCVIFPDVSERELCFHNVNMRRITLLKEDLYASNLEDRLINICRNVYEIDCEQSCNEMQFRNHTRMEENQYNCVLGYFSTHFSSYYNQNEIYFKTMSRIKYLTEQQLKLLESINSNPQICIKGGAGTGKTVLAKYKAKLDIVSGKMVLVLCTTEALRDDYRKEFNSQPNIDIFTKQYFEKNLKEINSKYDSIILDEGQDFTEEEFNEIKKITDNIYIFMDKEQVLRKERVEEEFSYFSQLPQFILNKNLRNSFPIKNVLYRIYGRKIESIQTAEKEVELIFLNNKSKNQLVEFFRKLYNSKIYEISEYSKEKPVFITTSSIKKSQFTCNYDKYYSVCREMLPDDDFCFPCDICTGSYFDTVRRLKGTEHDCVIVYDEEGLARSNIFNNVEKDALYSKNMISTAISRAKFDLTIIIPYKSDEECQLVSQHLGLGYKII